jgi:Rrf2 family protein
MCLAREISAQEEIPHYFLSKILQNLAREGLLKSTKGPGGGFQLAKPAKSITLYHIKRSVDGVSDLEECAVGLARCTDETPCPLHDTFKPLRKQIESYLKGTTLAEMAQAMEEKLSRGK